MASFAIEGAPLSPAEFEASVIASLSHRRLHSQKRSDSIAELMLEARSGKFPLTAHTLQHRHRRLFHGVEVEDPGRWPSFEMEIVCSHSGKREDVLHTAPPSNRMEAEMTRFLGWLETDSNPLPLRAAIAHLWFESVHHFADRELPTGQE